MLLQGRFSGGKIEFNEPLDKVLDNNIIKPTIGFTPMAWLKLKQLVSEANTEIGWHGIVEAEPVAGHYMITDIVVYPQTVSGATVTTDDKEYATWLMKFDDETFNKIRFQGHSHVNFGVTPSGVDDRFYDSILQNMQEGDYYIFMIINKKNDLNVWIYDYAQNIIFETKDILLYVQCPEGDIVSWAKEEMKQHVKTYIAPTYINNRVSTNEEILRKFHSESPNLNLRDDYYDPDDCYTRVHDLIIDSKFDEPLSKKGAGKRGKNNGSK